MKVIFVCKEYFQTEDEKVYFFEPLEKEISVNKKLKKEWLSYLAYPIVAYPKNENKNYILGEYLEPEVINENL